MPDKITFIDFSLLMHGKENLLEKDWVRKIWELFCLSEFPTDYFNFEVDACWRANTLILTKQLSEMYNQKQGCQRPLDPILQILTLSMHM